MRIDFNPGFLQKLPIDNTIKLQLDALGLQTTGSREGDLDAIKKAETQKLQNTENKPEIGQDNKLCESKPEPPWISFMVSLGLQPTGSREGDFIAISNKLDVLEAQATNETESAQVKALRSVFSQLMPEASSGTSSFQQPSTSTDSFAGQEQLAKLNKWFLNKKFV